MVVINGSAYASLAFACPPNTSEIFLVQRIVCITFNLKLSSNQCEMTAISATSSRDDQPRGEPATYPSRSVKIFEFVLAHLIVELPGLPFAVFTIYDSSYAITAILKKKRKTRVSDFSHIQFQPLCPEHESKDILPEWSLTMIF